MSKIRTRFFYGWWVVLTCALGLFLGPIPIVVFSFGVFLKPLIHEFHSNRGAVSFAFTLYQMIIAFGLPFAGRLLDRFGPRKIILPSTFIAGLILLSAYFCSGSIWQLYLFYVALGIAICGLGPVVYCHVISHWFDKHRGLALGLMMVGLGSGALIMPSAAQYLIANFGWRLAFGIVGLTILLITVPVLMVYLKERPEPMGLLPDGGSYFAEIPLRPQADPGLSWREARHTRTFWLLLSGFLLVSVSLNGCLTHIAAIVADRGASAQAAAFASSLFGAGFLVGRAGSGYLLDRFFAPRVAALIFACAAAGMALLGIASSRGLALAAAFFIGIGLGAEVDVMAYLTSRYFGLRFFGVIYGFLFAGFLIAGGLGTYLMGATFDALGSYTLALAALCMATFAGAGLMLCLGPYRYAKRLSDEERPALAQMPEVPGSQFPELGR
jgi:MFS family permease